MPHSDDWLSSVSAGDVRTVLQFGGILSIVSREVFKSLRFDDFLVANKKCGHRTLTSLMAPHLELLHLCEPDHRRFNFENLSSLRVLKVGYTVGPNVLGRILTAVGANLVELDITSCWMKRKTIRAIARYCQSLRVLKAGYSEYPGTLESIWSTIGSNLIELRVRASEKDFVGIARYCTRLEKLGLFKIHHLDFSSDGVVIDSLRALKRLRVLVLDIFVFDELPYFSKDNVRTILDVCPSDVHVHLHMSLNQNLDCTGYFRLFGTRLRVLSLNTGFFTEEKDVVAALANIEELSLRPFNGYYWEEFSTVMEPILAAPMPNLRKLLISSVDNSNILPRLSRSVINLREFMCFFGSRFDREEQIHVKGSDFTELLRANKQLRRITIDYGENIVLVKDKIVDFIPRLKDCKYLKDVVILYRAEDERDEDGNIIGMHDCGMLEEIRDACVSLRTKSLSLSVRGVSYLPS